MELDQKIFKWVWNVGKRYLGTVEPEPVVLPIALDGLQIFACIVFGRRVELRAIGQSGEFGAVDGEVVYLPLEHELLGDGRLNLDFLKLRLLLLRAGEEDAASGVLHRLRLLSREIPESRSLYKKISKVIQKYEKQPPAHVRRLSERSLRRLLFDFPIVPGRPVREFEPTELSPGEEGEKQQVEVELSIYEDSELLTPNKKEIEDYTLGHNFEKLETLDDFSGSWRDLDNEENPEELEDALKELKFAHRIRTAETPKAVISGTSPQGTASDAADAQTAENYIAYNEWDFKKRKYKIGFCRVFESPLTQQKPGYCRAMIKKNAVLYRRVEARFEKALFERRQTFLSTAGEYPDIDAVVAAQADGKSGRTPDERLYQAKRKRQKDLVIWFLIDNSLSTDAWIRGHRTLDAILLSVALCAEVLSKYTIRFGISLFHSRTRNDCKHGIIKIPGEPWSAVCDRLGVIEPAGYTRIGPALRRSTDLLAGHQAGKRWLLLFSDARPNDYDRYEGAYGLADVRQAVREAELQGVQSYGFGIRAENEASMDLLLGKGRGQLLQRPEDLPEALVRFAARLFA